MSIIDNLRLIAIVMCTVAGTIDVLSGAAGLSLLMFILAGFHVIRLNQTRKDT